MKEETVMKNEVGIYQLENGNWAFRLVFKKNGRKTNYRRKTDGKCETDHPQHNSQQLSQIEMI